MAVDDCGAIVHGVSTTFSKPRKRWSKARTVIYTSRVIFSLAKDKKKYKPRTRWCFAFAAVRFLSLSKEIVLKKEAQLFLSRISRSLSHSVLDIPPHADDDNYYFSAGDQKHLTGIVKDRNSARLRHFGGVEGLVVALKTDVEKGIHGNDDAVRWRHKVFGSNTYHKPPTKGFFHFVLQALMHTTIVSSLLYLALEIKENGLKSGSCDGGSVIVVVFIIVLVSAISNFRQLRQFEKLSKASNNNIQVEVMRDRQRQKVFVVNIVVGDIVFLKIGDQIPADGLFLDGYSLEVDESNMTGVSDNVEIDCNKNPFLFSGTKVACGSASMLVTSVGMNTAWGEIMSSRSHDSAKEQTPLQDCIDKVSSYIERIGLAFAFLVLVVLLVRYFTGNTEDDNGNREFKGSRTKIQDVLNEIVHIVAVAVTIVVVAVPEGLPLAFTLARAYSMKGMRAHGVMVRSLSACETMGYVTTICTDKTGTLTLNQMKVTKFQIGEEARETDASFAVASNVLDLLHKGVGLNTLTDSVYRSTPRSEPEFSASPTEKAILAWSILELGMDIENVKQNCTVLDVEAFSSEKKRSGVLMRKNDDNTFHVHWKGAAEIILGMCSNYYNCSGNMKSMDEGERLKLKSIIEDMATDNLRCLAFAHKQIPEEELECNNEDGNTHQKLKEDRLTLLGLVGLRDPCRPEVITTVKYCKEAGVDVKMITGDNFFTAIAMAKESGILNPNQDINNGEVVEGVEFRSWTPEERMNKVEGIRVLARSSPFDKLLMVQCLKRKGHVVATIGDGIYDVLALEEANIGLSMGSNQGTEVANERSNVIILEDTFASVAIVLKWGRCVHKNIQKFIQFQLTVNVATLVINFIAVVSVRKVPITPVQYLWVNLIMDTLGTVGLATQEPTDELMKMPPISRNAQLITNVMWRNLISQALYQILVLLALQYKGESILSVNEKVIDTMIFNTFVLCQVFNQFNARNLEKRNVFKGIHKNLMFLGIVGITIVLQVVMVEFLKKFADTERLDWGQWGACVGIAALSWPISWAIKGIPVSDKPFFTFHRDIPDAALETELEILRSGNHGLLGH